MTQTFDELDTLVARLKAVARQHEQHPGTEPPPFAYRERLGELLGEERALPAVRDPKRPRIEELCAVGRSDEAFLREAYRHLLGREPDPEGQRHYLALLPRAGRFYVLAELLRADEGRAHQAREGLEVPGCRWLTRPLGLADRLGPLGRVLRPPLRLTYRLASILLRPRLRLLGRLAVLEIRSERRDRLVSDVLLELDGELSRQASALERERRRGEAHEQRQESHELRQESQAQRLAEQEQALPALWSGLQHHRRAVERLLDGEAEPPAPAPARAAGQALTDAYYIAFESACRGSEADIRAHLLHYVPQIEAARQVGCRALDLGCGRGEWLTLLGERGFDAHGVDLNVAMVEHCRQAGLEVVHGDILAALEAQPDDSHALISAFHLAEHLPFETLYAMVDEARRVLSPGGVLILETPNPENLLVGSHTFYHDPTHRNPLTPTAMTFLLQYHGYGEVEIRRFNPYPEQAKVPGDDPLTERVNGHLCGPQDFAVIGCKVAPVTTDREAAASAEEVHP